MKIKVWSAALLVVVLALSVYYFLPTESEVVTTSDIDPVEEMEEIQPTLLYGFPIDSFEVKTGRVRRNQFLAEILEKYNVSGQDLYTLSQRSKKVYDVRRLKARSNYTIIHEKDSLKTAKKFIFEPSLTEYVVYHLDDSIYAELKEKPVEVVEKSVAVEIKSSMYEALVEKNSSPVLVNRLVDVFAWQVDFFRIAKGDRLKVVYDEHLVDNKVVGIGDIKAAYFEHIGKEYYAIPYRNKEKVDYFDEEGKSLRKTFLRAPLNFTRISSRYSLRRFHPVQKRYKAHLGTDYAAPTGTPIRTVGDGVVLEARYHAANGNYVKIRHNSNYTTQYLHMSKIARGIRPGAKVKQSQTIGYVGSTGLANGPHLCFRFWKNGRQVDALKVDLPASDGVEESKMNDFIVHAKGVKDRLDHIQFSDRIPVFASIQLPLPTVD